MENQETQAIRFGGFWRRVAAYAIDMIPIALLTGAAFYFFFGFDELIKNRFQNAGDVAVRIEFLKMRNVIRTLSLLVYIFYAAIMECSVFQATFGKMCMKVKVVDQNCNRIHFLRSLGRNLFKFVEYITLGIGVIWIAFNKRKKAWHDYIARTCV